jgi:hypothetical protein
LFFALLIALPSGRSCRKHRTFLQTRLLQAPTYPLTTTASEFFTGDYKGEPNPVTVTISLGRRGAPGFSPPMHREGDPAISRLSFFPIYFPRASSQAVLSSSRRLIPATPALVRRAYRLTGRSLTFDSRPLLGKVLFAVRDALGGKIDFVLRVSHWRNLTEFGRGEPELFRFSILRRSI